MRDRKMLAITKSQNLIGKTIAMPRKSFHELSTNLHSYLQEKQNRLRRPMSVEVRVASLFYISVEVPHRN